MATGFAAGLELLITGGGGGEGGRSADRGYRINDTHIHSYSLSAANSRVACLIYNGTLHTFI